MQDYRGLDNPSKIPDEEDANRGLDNLYKNLMKKMEEDNTPMTAEWAQLTQIKTEPISTTTWIQTKDMGKACQMTPAATSSAPAPAVPVIQMTGKVNRPILPPQHFDSLPEHYNKFQMTLNLYLDLNKMLFNDNQKNLAFTLSLM